MLIDLYLKDKEVVVFGGGNEAELKVLKVLDGGARVTVVSKVFTNEISSLAKEGKIRIIKYDLEDGYAPLKRRLGNPFVMFLATDDVILNKQGVGFAKNMGAMVCVVDTPQLCDFAMPAIAKIGKIRVGITTGGRSPLIAKLLRQRIETLFTEEDLMHLELQEYTRKKIRPKISEFPSRKKFLWKIVEDNRIQSLIKERKLEQAKLLIDRMVKQVA
jgi:precorrin-2 dehydrogenase/sirohydrochlorin ferrochelatase